MKSFVTTLFILLISGLVVLTYKDTLAEQYYDLAYFSFCEEPIRYKIGTIDPKFNVESEIVKTNIKAASEIWNTYLEKDLFVYDSNATLTINLLFDERQRALNKVYDLEGSVIEGKEDIETQVKNYEAKLSQLKNKSNDLNEKIRYWNNRGGAPADIYDQLIEEQKQLNKQIDELNRIVAEINNNSASVNEQINTLNSYVNEFNKIISTHPEEGIYDPFRNVIEIYFYDSENRFIHTTAHEMGHALGLEHVSNSIAILNPITSDNIELTKDDMLAIDKFCEQQNRFVFLFNNAKRNIKILAERFTQQQD